MKHLSTIPMNAVFLIAPHSGGLGEAMMVLPMSECGNDFPFFSNLPNKDGPCLYWLLLVLRVEHKKNNMKRTATASSNIPRGTLKLPVNIKVNGLSKISIGVL